MALHHPGVLPAFQFKPRILFGNDTKLNAASYGIRLPDGLAEEHVPAPIFVNYNKILALAKEGGDPPPEGEVYGLTVAKFAVSFANPLQQWRPVSSALATGWQFQGGDVFLQTTITLFLWDYNQPTATDPVMRHNDLRRQRFVVVMEHELEHVADEIGIVSNWMTPELYGDKIVKRYLVKAEPVHDHMFRAWFAHGATGFSDYLIREVWEGEHIRRIGKRDTPKEYGEYAERLSDLNPSKGDLH